MTSPSSPALVLLDNPWLAIPDAAPFVAPDDLPALVAFNARARPEHRAVFDLLPEPWLGHPGAPVVVLALNPGYSAGDHALHADAGFRAAVRATLAGTPTDYPFYYLTPGVDSPGHAWCRQRLKALVASVAAARPEVDAVRLVANRLFWMEWFPFHSTSYAHDRLRLPSHRYTIASVRAAVARGAIVVIARRERLWREALPELATAPNVYRIANPQYISISPKNLPDGFDAVVRAITGRRPGRHATAAPSPR